MQRGLHRSAGGHHQRDGSLLQIAADRGLPILLYEAGEALRFDEVSIRAGLHGILSVMRALGMLPKSRSRRVPVEPAVARSSFWMRAPQSGILRAIVPLGARVRRGERVGIISDPYGEREVEVTSNAGGIVIGRATLPLVNEGDALFHIARVEAPEATEAAVEEFQATLSEERPLAPDEEAPIV